MRDHAGCMHSPAAAKFIRKFYSEWKKHISGFFQTLFTFSGIKFVAILKESIPYFIAEDNRPCVENTEPTALLHNAVGSNLQFLNTNECKVILTQDVNNIGLPSKAKP